MFGRSTRSRFEKLVDHRTRLCVEQLEDRVTPHSGVMQYTVGLTPNAGVAGIVLGPDGNFWFAESNASRIGRIEGVASTANVITEFTLPAGRGPLNLAVGPDGNIWFTENTGDRIGRINPKAGSDAAIQASIVEFAVPGAGSQPNDIVAGPDGALWFTQTGSDQIGRITTAGAVTDEFAVPGAGSAPAGIAAGADGALWFTQAGSGQIGRITTAGTVTEFAIPVPNAAAFSDPEDITAGPNGLYFTDFGRDQIGRITYDGQITQFNLPVGRGPNQIVFAGDGNLYFTETASSRIGKLPANALAPGRPTFGTPPLEEFDFIARDSAPLGLALAGPDVAGSEDIFFTLNNGNAVATFAAHLAQITAVATGPSVTVYDIHLLEVRTFSPFTGYQGTLNVAIQDMAGAHAVGSPTNGVPDLIVAPTAGGPPHVQIFDQSDNRLLASFFAFDPGYRGGIALAAADVNGDNRNDLIVAAGTHVKVIDGTKLGDVGTNGVILDSALLASFLAFPFGALRGVTLAAGDVNRDGLADIIIAAGAGGPPHVKVVDATKLTQVLANGQIADTALLASFFAFGPTFRGGVSVAISFDVSRADIVVGAGAGGPPHVKVIDTNALTQVQANGQIADTALKASFLAFDPAFRGGVSVAADDLSNADGVPELIISSGPGAPPSVKVIDGAKAGQVQSNGQIAAAAELASFVTKNPASRAGVNVAADADHRDGTIFGTPGVNQPGGQANSRNDINDMYIFQSPTNPDNTVLVMDVSPFSTTGTPAAFVPGTLYDFRIVNRDLVNTTDDLTFRVTFGPPDPANGNKQDVTVRALPAARFASTGGVVVKGFTGENTAVRGVGGTGAMFRAAEQDDPFFFDVAAFNRFLNGGGLSNGTAADNTAGKYPSGTSNGGAGDGADSGALGFDSETGDYNGVNFFANANTLSIVMEIPSAKLTGTATDSVSNAPYIGYWGRTEANGVQLDRMGRPAINTAVIPPVPRGSNFPADGSALNRFDVRTQFNQGHPRDDRANFADDVTSVLAAVYPIGQNGQAPTVAGLLLPDILVYRPSSNAGFFNDTVGTLGQPGFFLAGGRKLSDDIISTEVAILTDPDSPFNLDGGANLPPLVATQNVRDDNGQKLTDGSVDKPVAQGGMGTGQRASLFPYIGARNANPSSVPGGNPAP